MPLLSSRWQTVWSSAGPSGEDVDRMTSDLFVGEDRTGVVHELVDAFDRVARGGGPELTCLVAPIGWGKTRIVQELYGRLAAERQGAPPYWPRSIVEATDVVEPTRLRKRIYPGRFTAPAASTPSWFWWGLSCERKADGRPAQAIEEAKPQLFTHAEAIEQTLSSASRLRRQVGSDQAAAAMSVVAGLLGLFVPPVGWAATVHDSVKQLWETGRVVADERRRRRRARADRDVDAEEADRRAVVEELAGWLVALSSAPFDLPTVVVLDDAHEAAESAIALVDRLMASPTAKVLIVATAWPDQLGLQAREQIGFGGWLEVTAHDRVRRVELRPLDEADLGVMVREVAPATRPEVVDALVARSGGNPFVLELILSLGMVRRSVVDGAIGLSADDLAVVPSELRRLYLEKWRDLPEPLRDVLAVASLQGSEFVAGGARDAAAAIGLQDADALLPEAVDPYAWVRELDDDLRGFVERPQFSVVADEANDRLSSRERESARIALMAYVVAAREDGRWEDLSDRARRSLLENHVRLARDGLTEDLAAAARSALELADLLVNEHRYRDAVPLGENALTWLNGELEPDEELVLRAGVARCVGEGGRPGEAAARLEALVEDSRRRFGPVHRITLALRVDFVAWLGEAGDEDRALALSGELVDDLTQEYGADHRETLAARVNRAFSLGERGRVAEAVAELEAVLTRQTQTLGADAPATFATRSNLASFLSELGRHEESAAIRDALLVDQLRVLGPDHPETLATRVLIADRRRRDGQPDFDTSLVDDQLRILGPEHPDALRARVSDGAQMIAEGRSDLAVSLLQEAYGDCVRVLGADAPDTLACRGHLVRALWDAGRLDEAAEHLAGLIENQGDVLDQDGHDALWHREELGRLLIEAGRLTEAAGVFSSLVEDRSRVLGPADRATLAARSHLAGIRAETGHLDEALQDYMALADDCGRVLGDDDPDTLVVLHSLAVTAASAGLLEEAATIMDAVVQARTRVLGADHPDTAASRQMLDEVRARWSGP